MKKITLFILLISLFACKKKECDFCTAYITNVSHYPIKVKRDGQQRPTILPGKTNVEDLSPGVKHRLEMEFETPFEHNVYDRFLECNGDCEDFEIILY